MSTLIWIYAVSCIVSVPLLMVLSAHEHKKYRGYCELTLDSVLYSIVFGMLPVINLIALCVMGIMTGVEVVVWSNKK